MAVVIIGTFQCTSALRYDPFTLIVHVVIFLSMLLLGLAILLLALTWVMSQMLIAPNRMTDAKAAYLLKRLSPGDLGMHFEEISFQVRDEQTGKQLKIAAWWIPGRKDEGGEAKDEGGRRQTRDEGGRMKDEEERAPLHPSSFRLHPFPDSTVILLHGFADAKVGAIAWAPLWQSLGYNILAIDLRAHGESGGRFTTAGYFERHDVDQVINELRASRPDETKHLVLFGISLGAAVAAAVAEKRDDVDAIILGSPYQHFKAAAILHGKYMNLPFGFLAPLAIRLGEWRCGASFDEVAPGKTLASSKSPALIFFGSDDPLVDRRGFAPGTCTIHTFENTGHVLGIVADTQQYREYIRQFLQALHKNRT